MVTFGFPVWSNVIIPAQITVCCSAFRAVRGIRRVKPTTKGVSMVFERRLAGVNR
jgi:hypothetical protein